MLGFVLIYFIGRYFYNLADEHGRSKWGFAVLGVVAYYAGTFIGGVLIAMLLEFNNSLDNTEDILLGLMAMPLGLLTCWGFYRILKKQWSAGKKIESDVNILDEEFME